MVESVTPPLPPYLNGVMCYYTQVNFTFALHSSLWFLHYFLLLPSLFPSLHLYSTSFVRSFYRFSLVWFFPSLFALFLLSRPVTLNLCPPVYSDSQQSLRTSRQSSRRNVIRGRGRAVRTQLLTPVASCVVLLRVHYYSYFGGTYMPCTDIRTVLTFHISSSAVQ